MPIHRATRILTTLTLAATLFAVTACHDNGSSTAPPARSSSPAVSNSPSTTPPTQTTPNVYKGVAKPCTAINFAPIEAVLGKNTADLIPQSSKTTGPLTFMTCSRRLGPPTDGHAVMVQIETFKGASAEDQYNGIRGVQKQQMPLTDIPGLGQGAYTRADPDTGPHLVVYDGNLYLEIAALDVTLTPQTQTQLYSAMTQMAKQILTKLRT